MMPKGVEHPYFSKSLKVRSIFKSDRRENKDQESDGRAEFSHSLSCCYTAPSVLSGKRFH